MNTNDISPKPQTKHFSKVSLRRGQQVISNISTHLLIPGIKSGKLFKTDEFSGDGVQWIGLGDHHQLKDQFPEFSTNEIKVEGYEYLNFFEIEQSSGEKGEELSPSSTAPPNFENELGRLAEMIEDING